MAWNEPGGGNRDPWGGGGRDQGPPDLDEILRKLNEKLAGLLGGSGAGGGRAGGSPSPYASAGGIGLIIAILIGVWLLLGFYTVDEGTRGVVQRFGRFVDITEPGLHWRLPLVENYQIVDVEQRRAEEIGYRFEGGRQPVARAVAREALMLTEDENIVDVRLNVQYRILNPRDYLFNTADPRATLRQVVESAARETIGNHRMDFVLTDGRAEIVADIKSRSQKILDGYKTGLQITNVNLQDAQAPEEVQDAFADAIKAREDEQRLINEANAYYKEILNRAEGQKNRRANEGAAYRDQVIARAEGEASRFEQLLVQYQKAPDVTRERLYLETLEAVLSSTGMVLVDVPGGNNLFYLPLDRLLKAAGRDSGPAEAVGAPPPETPVAQPDNGPGRLRDGRGRDTR
jgi:membrane protease subunit HflK